MTEWQDISTAPRDGTWLLLWEKYLDTPFVGQWWDGKWIADTEHVDAEGGWDGAIVISDVDSDDVTHWQPLPKPPNEKG